MNSKRVKAKDLIFIYRQFLDHISLERHPEKLQNADIAYIRFDRAYSGFRLISDTSCNNFLLETSKITCEDWGMQIGWIEVIAGSMYSGKTEELIKRVRRAQFAKQKTQVFKPALDNRYHETKVSSHDQTQIQAIPLKSIHDVWDHLESDTHVVGFDEGQFLSQDFIAIAKELAARGKRVIIAGLDMDWKGEPFEPIPTLMAIAEEVTKPRAICTVCGNLATYTQKLRGSSSQIEIGSQDNYEARCRQHFSPVLINLDAPKANTESGVITPKSRFNLDVGLV